MAGTEPVLPIGSTLAGYRIDRVLGSGSYGTVYLATDLNPQLARRVALKVLRPTLGHDEAFRGRFRRESRLVSQLGPVPAIVTVYDAGEDEGLLWIASQFIDGTDLYAAIETNGRLPPAVVSSIMAQIAGGLDVAHAAGIVHRDVKPANLLLTKNLDRAYLADFGMSKSMSSEVDSSLTHVGQFVGTVKYAAPEQLDRGVITGQADQYSLACVTYEMLTGTAPFDGEMAAIILAHAQKPLPDVRTLAPALPAAVNNVIRRATAKDPHARYPTCTDFADALATALRRTADPTVVDEPVRRLPDPSTRRDGVVPRRQGPPQPPVVARPGQPPGARPGQTPGQPPGQPPGSRPRQPSGQRPTAIPQPQQDQHRGISGTEEPRRRRSTGALLGIGAAIAVPVVALVAILGLCVTGDGCPWSSPAPFPNEVEQRLLDVLPAAIRNRCDRDLQVTDDRMVAAVTCRPNDDRVDAVAFRQLADRAGLDAVFADAIRGTPVVIGADTHCSRNTGATNEYDTADQLYGRVACYRDGGSSHLVWTTEELRVLGEARQNDRFDADLYDWWADLLEVIDGTEEDDLVLLRSYVPQDIEEFCEPVDLGGTVLAALDCALVGLPADSITYRLYGDTESMQADYDDLRIDAGLPLDLSDSPGLCPVEDDWFVGEGDLSPGRIACASSDARGTVLFWTDVRINVLSYATQGDGDTAALIDWWENNAGPLVP